MAMAGWNPKMRISSLSPRLELGDVSDKPGTWQVWSRKTIWGSLWNQIELCFFYFDLWISKGPKGILPRFLSAYHTCPFPFCTSENVLGQNLILQFALIEASVLPKIMNFLNGPPRDPVASNGTQDGKWLMQGAAWKENDDDQDWWNMAKHGLQWMAVFGFWWGKKHPPRFIHVFMPQKSR